MADNDFIHLHVHTEYSLLDGLSDISKLAKHAKAMDMSALAISDHGAMYGVIDFFRECKKQGIKPIIGMEGYVAPRTMHDRDSRLDKTPFHLLMLAMNETGYKNLCRIATASMLEGYYYKPRIDRDFLERHSEGLIVTSGCLAAEIPNLVNQGRDDTARELIDWYLQIFGRERFYLELQQHDIPALNAVNQWLVEIGKKDDVQFLATNDVHYVLADDYDAHDTLLCIQTSALKSEPRGDGGRMGMSDNSYYLADKAQMWQTFGHIQDGAPLLNSLAIAEMCNVDLDTKGYRLPIFPVPDGFAPNEYMRYLCEKGLEWRYGASRARTDQALIERLNYELRVIDEMGFVTYFLIVWDLCEYARAADIWWNVRGSGAGSLAAYTLGITNIDPIENNLLFERFLNPGRVSMPDIDMDFPDDRRSEMIAYTVRKYGEDKVAAIITFGTLGAKAAVRDVGRAFNVDLALVNKVAGLIPTEPKPKPINTYVEENPELRALVGGDPQLQEVMDMAAKLQGVSRNSSTHAAGVIVADKPLVEYLPLSRQSKEDDSLPLKQVTQFPMETAESIGLLKIDFLGLSTLTIMRLASDLIEKNRGVRYTMDNIPYRPTGDAQTDQMLRDAFALLSRGDTVGVFQVESSGMQQMLREMRPTKFENIIAAVSLYRPGPMDYIPMYNRRMHGEEPVEYHHPRLEDMLGETYGIMVYQEQLMQIASAMFGYALGEADLMRRAVSKKKKEDLLKHREIFLQRGPELDATVTPEIAGKIFADIEFFANYGFNKSHAADYAVITVQSAFLKAQYAPEYMAALLTVYFDAPDKVTTCLAECKRLNIPLLPPSINHSNLDFDIEMLTDGRRAIRFGLSGVKNAGVGAVQRLISARAEGGVFTSLDDLCRRVDLHSVGKRPLEMLIKVGALDEFGTRPQLLNALDRIVAHSQSIRKTRETGQIGLFGDSAAQSDDLLTNLPGAAQASQRDMLNWEKELLGIYISSHPIDPVLDMLQGTNIASSDELLTAPPEHNERPVRVVGLVAGLRKTVTKNRDMMGIIKLEDKSGSIDAVAFPKTWAKVQDQVVEGAVILVMGKLDLTRGAAQIVVENITQEFQSVTAALPSAPVSSSGMLNGSASASYEAWHEPIMAGGSDEEPPGFDELPPLDDDGALNGVWSPNRAPQTPAPDLDSYLDGDDAPTTAPPQMITLRFHRNGDEVRDLRRLKRLIQEIISHPGTARFRILVCDEGVDTYIMDFDDKTTCWGEPLEKLLNAMNGVEVVEVGLVDV
jgi:DNA polymerase-3 subunit alpha